MKQARASGRGRRPRRSRAPRWLLVAVLLGLCLCSGCVTKEKFLRKLRAATKQEHLPKVTACWEEELEAAGFEAEYLAVVDFTVEAGSGRIRDAVVKKMMDTHGKEPRAAGERGQRLSACVEKALSSTDLGKVGLEPRGDVAVSDFRIAFRDASSEARQAASERAPTILLGPRADRCKGLYAHEPPREPAVLYSELEEAREAAARSGAEDLDALARALQKSYDVSLELRDRLFLDSQREDLPEASRDRLATALSGVDGELAGTAKKIGCRAPELDRRRGGTR